MYCHVEFEYRLSNHVIVFVEAWGSAYVDDTGYECIGDDFEYAVAVEVNKSRSTLELLNRDKDTIIHEAQVRLYDAYKDAESESLESQAEAV